MYLQYEEHIRIEKVFDLCIKTYQLLFLIWTSQDCQNWSYEVAVPDSLGYVHRKKSSNLIILGILVKTMEKEVLCIPEYPLEVVQLFRSLVNGG